MLSSSPSTTSPLSQAQLPHLKRSQSVGPDHTVYVPSANGEKLTLPAFVSKYHKSLPLPIRVCRGYCGPNEETSISEGDHFNVHFIKHTTVVLVEMENGYRYNVPLNSAVPFGILYDPQGIPNQAMKGYTFTKVADMLQMNELPVVIRARKAHESSNPENSIVANELLLVRRAARKRIGKNQLKVFSLRDKREKTLSESCLGHFSTKPRDVCMYLPDVVKYAPDIFPCKAILFTNKETSRNNVPSKLSSSIVTLMHHSIETSLVVTSALEINSENARMLDIPIDLDIQVRVANTTEVEAQKLAQSTAFLYNNFNPSRLQSYVRNAKSRGMEETQRLLYRTIRSDSRQRGIKITRPSSIMVADQQGSTHDDAEDQADSIYDDIFPVSEPRYMSPRPASTSMVPTTGDKPPLPERNKTHLRTPGYSYVEVDDIRRCGPATRAVDQAPSGSGFRGEQAHGDSSFGSTGSGGAIVERSMSCGVDGGGRSVGEEGECSSRGSYSDGAIVARRRSGGLEERRGGGGGGEGEGKRCSEHELDAFLMDLKEMALDLDTVLQQREERPEGKEGEGREGEPEDYCRLSYNHSRKPSGGSPSRCSTTTSCDVHCTCTRMHLHVQVQR